MTIWKLMCLFDKNLALIKQHEVVVWSHQFWLSSGDLINQVQINIGFELYISEYVDRLFPEHADQDLYIPSHFN